MIEYIKESNRFAQQNNRERHIYGTIPVYLKDHLLTDVDLNAVLADVQRLIPRKFVSNIDIIYVGDFKDFHKDNRDFNAMYEHGALYISNDQDDKNDMIDDIVHEIAHAVEEQYYKYIYSDNSVEREFLGKRKRLYHICKQEDLEPSYNQFLETEYDLNFDNYLHKQVGYPTLNSLVIGLFYSPYAVTSLREYFANGFENYFLKEPNYLKKISPSLYKRIDDLVMNIEPGGNNEI